MPKERLPVYQIQDFNAHAQKEHYFYLSSLPHHLQEHLFIREPHKHNFYIVLFITKGSGSHTIDFRKYTVAPGTVFFMIPGQVHSWELSDDVDGFVVFFSAEFYSNNFPFRRLSDFPFFNALMHQPVLILTPAEGIAALRLYHAMQEEYQQQETMRNELLGNYLNILLIQLSRRYLAQGKEMTEHARELTLLQQLENLVEQHYKAHLPVTFYADQLNVTAKHLKDVCKRALGKTTSELIQARSVLEAQRLLVHSALTSSQIAAELGYTDIAYFFRFFKKHTGITPEQFRAANKQNFL